MAPPKSKNSLPVKKPSASASGGSFGRGVGIPRMSRVLRWHEGPLARAFYKRPALEGLEPVVVVTEEVDPLEEGDV